MMAGPELSDQDIVAVRDLIQRSDLSAIEFHEVSARLIPFDGEAPDQEEANVSIQLEHRVGDKDFGIRMVGSVTNSTKEVRVTAAAEYTMSEGETPAERVILMFANEVAVMSLFPYFREGVSSVSAKVFKEPLLLPTIERGMIKYDLPESDNER